MGFKTQAHLLLLETVVRDAGVDLKNLQSALRDREQRLREYELQVRSLESLEREFSQHIAASKPAGGKGQAFEPWVEGHPDRRRTVVQCLAARDAAHDATTSRQLVTRLRRATLDLEAWLQNFEQFMELKRLAAEARVQGAAGRSKKSMFRKGLNQSRAAQEAYRDAVRLCLDEFAQVIDLARKAGL